MSFFPVPYVSDVDLQLPLEFDAPRIDGAVIYRALQEIARSAFGRALKDDYPIAFRAFLREQSIGRLYLQCTENIAVGAAVNIFTSGGVAKIQNASSADATKPAHGFMTSDVARVTDDYCEVTPWTGLNLLLTGLTKGASYYLSDTPGEIDSTPGTVTQFMGIALETTCLMFNICCMETGGGGGGGTEQIINITTDSLVLSDADHSITYVVTNSAGNFDISFVSGSDPANPFRVRIILCLPAHDLRVTFPTGTLQFFDASTTTGSPSTQTVTLISGFTSLIVSVFQQGGTTIHAIQETASNDMAQQAYLALCLSTGQIRIIGGANTASAGAGAAPPATVDGYLKMTISDGSLKKIPYYDN